MTQEQAIWLAGLLEGEGNFHVRLMHKANCVKSSYTQMSLQLSMTDEDVVRRAADIMNVNVCIRNIRGQMKKPAYVARATGDKAVIVMKAILPYMGIRRTKAIEECLSRWANRRTRSDAMRDRYAA